VDSERIAKNSAVIERGNHKSAIKNLSALQEIMTKEVKQGWMLPVPLHFINHIPHSEIAPVGIDSKQYKCLPDGTRVQKFRLTHDQSFKASYVTSVNKRIEWEKLDPLFYGGCLSRSLHYIVSIQARYPKTKMLIGKSDFKSVYRRVTLNGETAARCTMMCKQFGLISLRLTFRGSPCPNEWCLFSELCTDLANDILHCESWSHESLKSPHQDKLPAPTDLPDSADFNPAAELDVDIPHNDMGRVVDFIDDGIAIVPDIGNNEERGVTAMLLAIHTLCRLLDENEPIQWEDCLSLGKLTDEGQMSEVPMILGWQVNTRLLALALPEKKFKIWQKDIKQMINSKSHPCHN
jgi:hypothetical protein